MNHSQFRKAMTHVKNLENSIRIYVGEYYSYNNIEYQEAVKSFSNLLSNVIPVKYLLIEYYQMDMKQIVEEIFYHLSRIEDTIEKLPKVGLFQDEELTHVANLHKETYGFFCELLVKEAEIE